MSLPAGSRSGKLRSGYSPAARRWRQSSRSAPSVSSREIRGVHPVSRVERIVGPYELPENFACQVAEDDSSHTSSYGEAYTIKFFYQPYTNEENEARTDNHARTQHHDRENPNNPIETILFTDGLKQVLQTKKDGSLYTAIGQAPMDAMILSGRATLDPYGRVVRQYYPSQAYKGATDNTFIATVDEDGIDPTVTTYDILDRTLSTTLPDTTLTSMSYDIAGDRFTTR